MKYQICISICLTFFTLISQANKSSTTDIKNTILIGNHFQNGFSLTKQKTTKGDVYFLVNIQNNKLNKAAVITKKYYQTLMNDIQRMDLVLKNKNKNVFQRKLASQCGLSLLFKGDSSDSSATYCVEKIDRASQLKIQDWLSEAGQMTGVR